METKDFERLSNNKGALINKDTDALRAYKQQKKASRAISGLEERISNLENSIDDIKSLLLQVLNKNDNSSS